MQRFEYKVIAAPDRPAKAKGVRGTQARFAHALAEAMNQMAAEGWEYVRAETLPCEERTGLSSKTVNYQNMLVFRRALAEQTTLPPDPVTQTQPRVVAVNSPRTPLPRATGSDTPQPVKSPLEILAAARASLHAEDDMLYDDEDDSSHKGSAA